MSSVAKKWFIERAGQISGPYTSETIESEIQTATPRDPLLFWTRGQAQWLDSANWDSNLKQSQFSKAARETTTWSVELNGFIQKLDMEQVRDFIEKNFDEVWSIRFKPEHVDTWLEISQLPSLMNMFDLARVEERAPILGAVTLEFAGTRYTSRAKDISSSGIGVADLGAIPVGEIVAGVLDSPNLAALVHTHVQVIYRNADGQAGLRFVGLTAEHTTAVIDYLKRFAELRSQPIEGSLKNLGREINEKTPGGMRDA